MSDKLQFVERVPFLLTIDKLKFVGHSNERRCRVMALNGRVLLLNQTYEPLGTVSVARAIIMTFKNTVFVHPA